MAGLIAQAHEREGFSIDRSIEAALPMPVWAVDFEVERERTITAAELAVLRLIDSGVGTLQSLTSHLGLGEDIRLAETVLVKLLGAGAIEPKGDGFLITPAGLGWKVSGNVTQRELVTFDVRLDPTSRAFEWVGDERPVFATETTWTIELPPTEDEELLRRKPELAKLVREDGLPDDEDRAPGDKRTSIDLLAFSIASRRTHWRAVRIDVWRHPDRGQLRLVGNIAEAEHPGLTDLLAGHKLDVRRKRIVPAATSGDD